MVEAELNKENEEEPCFDDPPEFVDDIDDEGLISPSYVIYISISP